MSLGFSGGQVIIHSGATRNTFIAALAEVRATGGVIALEPGEYVFDSGIDLLDLSNVAFRGAATIRYPSHDTQLAPESRRAFTATGCRRLTFEGVRFIGGRDGDGGAAVHLQGSSDCAFVDCESIDGGNLVRQDAQSTDRGLRLLRCKVRNFSSILRTGSDAVVRDCEFTVDATINDLSHGIYIFAGRSNVLIDGCLFRGVRKTGVKVSGSSLPISDVRVVNSMFEGCGKGVEMGADQPGDALHTGMAVLESHFVNCGNSGEGFQGSHSIHLIGMGAGRCIGNVVRYTGDAQQPSNAVRAISVNRQPGGPPVGMVTVRGNHVESTGATNPGNAATFAIQIDDVGVASVSENFSNAGAGVAFHVNNVGHCTVRDNVSENTPIAMELFNNQHVRAEGNAVKHGAFTSNNAQLRLSGNVSEEVVNNFGMAA